MIGNNWLFSWDVLSNIQAYVNLFGCSSKHRKGYGFMQWKWWLLILRDIQRFCVVGQSQNLFTESCIDLVKKSLFKKKSFKKHTLSRDARTVHIEDRRIFTTYRKVILMSIFCNAVNKCMLWQNKINRKLVEIWWNVYFLVFICAYGCHKQMVH